MKKHEQAGIGPREIVAVAEQLAKKDFMAKLKAQGKRITLTPMPLVRLQREWLETSGDRF